VALYSARTRPSVPVKATTTKIVNGPSPSPPADDYNQAYACAYAFAFAFVGFFAGSDPAYVVPSWTHLAS
jgi:hypothetical protein